MGSSDVIGWAQSTSERLMSPLGRRWIHVQEVARLAGEVGRSLGEDRDTLIAAAYLHDIGYAESLAQEGFHPWDGARYVRDHGYEDLARLVAHHTGARVEAELRGIQSYTDDFPFGDSPLDQALTYCDLTTGPDGSPVTLDERIAEINFRYGPDHVTARAVTMCIPEFRRAVADTELRMSEAGIPVGR